MKKEKRILTRRDFIRSAAGTALIASLSLRAQGQEAGAAGKTRVVLVRDADALDAAMRPNPAAIQRMLDDAVCALLDVKDPIAAWKRLVKPTDIVGIKSNVWKFLPTPVAVEQAINRRIADAGVPDRNIGIDDRGVLQNSLFRNATALINVRPFRSHHWSGVGSCIKNYIMFVPKPYEYHGNSCADLATIWNEPIVKGKTRLNVLVLLTPLFYGIGPHHYDPTYVWSYKGLLVGTDPVAADATALRLFEAKRRAHFGEDRPFTPPARHIALADTRHHLGTADPNKIELVKLGWTDSILL
jgi:hypothetical protein